MGKDESVKIVIATYIATIAVQGVGNLLAMAGKASPQLLGFLGYSLDMNIVSTIKILIFVTLVIVLAIRGGFVLAYDQEMEGIWETMLTGAFGFATAGLLLSTLLTYIAARPILDTQIADSPSLAPLLLQSRLVQIMVLYQDLWFSIPAFLLLAIGIFASRRE